MYYICDVFNRQLAEILKQKSEELAVVLLQGPRLSGKGFLVRRLFPDYTFVSLDEPEIYLQAVQNPRQFLDGLPEKAVIENVQLVADLPLLLLSRSARRYKNRKWIALSSADHLKKAAVALSVTKSFSILTLLPLGQNEHNRQFSGFEEALFYGGFPAVLENPARHHLFYSSYVSTFLQKDVLQLQRIRSVPLFLQFLKNCAVHAGKTLDYSALARETGISVNTAKQWVQLLVASWFVFLLPPYPDDFGKRMVCTPKLYFTDTGLLSFLLGIKSPAELAQHPLKEAVFENFVLLELLKHRLHRGLAPNLYYWRDNRKNELKCLIAGHPPRVVEFCPQKVFKKDTLKQVKLWKWLSGYDSRTFQVVYGGGQTFQFMTKVYSWQNLDALFSALDENNE